MVRKILAFFIFGFFKLILSFRYRVKIKGIKNIEKSLKRPGGTLILPNHPTIFVDPTYVTLACWEKFKPRPVVVEYMYYLPFVNSLMRYLRAFPIPNLSASNNSIKRRRSEKVLESIAQAVRNGDNFLIYPAGKAKYGPQEKIGAASGVHTILQKVPEANVVLVKTSGLWGSMFSRGISGKSPDMFGLMLQGLKIAFKNLLFFTPKREVTIEFIPAPDDFPRDADRMTMNRWLEDWYDRPDGLKENPKGYKGESFVQVSYSMWGDQFLDPWVPPKDEEFHLSKIPEKVKIQLINHIAELAKVDPKEIRPSMDFSSDLGMDSLDQADILSYLSEQFDVKGVEPFEVTTVGKALQLAAKIVKPKKPESDEAVQKMKLWNKKRKHQPVSLPDGQTLPEVFLKNCDRWPNRAACADARSGVLTYRQVKAKILVLTDLIRKLPGKHIGILLPSSVAANLTILACQLAGKVPVMINWTVGPRHLESVIELSKIEKVLSSWAFIERVENVDFGPIDDMLIMLEDFRAQITLKDKIRAFWRSYKSTEKLLSFYQYNKLNKETCAVILFTSGTEGLPKGVPLTHRNILSNLHSVSEVFDVYTDDVVYGFLPPFHSFGFTITGLLPLLVGIRVVYAPDPTDGPYLAKGIKKWGVSIIASAPTFVKGIISAAEEGALQSLKLVVTGAEKTPDWLSRSIKELSGASLIEGYGITECSPAVTLRFGDKGTEGVGKPIPGVKLCIVEPESHALLSEGKRGLVLVHGPNVFSGYLNRGVHSPFIWFQERQWYSTGDLGHLDKEGNLVLDGRLKRFVKIGGEMVNLKAIEDALMEVVEEKGWAKDCEGPSLAVSAKEVPGERTEVYLFPTFEISLGDVNALLKTLGFSNLVKISNLFPVDKIPVLGTGKTNYRKLEEAFLGEK